MDRKRNQYVGNLLKNRYKELEIEKVKLDDVRF